MKTALKILLGLVVVLVLLAAGGLFWAGGKAADALARTVETHTVDFPVPFPLDSAEVAELGLGPDEAAALALTRAQDRGRHLLQARYGCTDCHGKDFSGGVMVDDPAIGTILGPNITSGAGGRIAGYGPADWDRIVRHGVLPGGTPAAMPSQDFQRMSDQELSDIVAFLSTVAPVDNEVPRPSLGPLGKILIATGQLPLSVDLIGDHRGAHRPLPPVAEATVEFGEHLAGVCTGCHGMALVGGPVPGGDPSWPPAANLTPHAEGLAGWGFDDFVTVMRQGRRPDGTPLREPMTLMQPFAQNATDTEMQALWAYLQSLPPAPTGG